MSTESGMVLVPRIPTDEIVDSVRYMLTGIELHSGRRTIGNFRTHCDHSGVDFSHWPTWATDGKHDDEHLTKSGLGELLYATLIHAAAAPASPPTPAVDAKGMKAKVRDLLDGMENCIESAKANGDKYSFGYMTAMLADLRIVAATFGVKK